MLIKIQDLSNKYYLHVIFLFSFASVIGSLYFSNVLMIEPCYLCWWQRIFMYPLFFLSAVSLIFKIRLQKLHVLALTIPGFLFALYHYLMQTFGLFKEFSTCVATSKPCDAVDVVYLGFITIPFLSLMAFIVINLIVISSVNFPALRERLKK